MVEQYLPTIKKWCLYIALPFTVKYLYMKSDCSFSAWSFNYFLDDLKEEAYRVIKNIQRSWTDVYHRDFFFSKKEFFSCFWHNIYLC